MHNPESSTNAVEPSAAPVPSNRYALFIVFLVVFIDLLGFGIVLPMLPVIANTYVATIMGPDADPKTEGLIIGLLMASFSLMQFLFAPGWGRLSDRVGRRPILLLGLGGSVVFYSLFGYAASLSKESALLALILLFVARSGAGIAGATIATAQAVIADSTAPEKRKHGMALIGAAFGIGFTFGPLIAFGSLTVFPEHLEAIGYTAAGLSLIALLLGFRLLPETRRFETAPQATDLKTASISVGRQGSHESAGAADDRLDIDPAQAEVAMRRRVIDLSAVKRALGSRTIGPVILTFFLASLGFAAFETTLALLLEDVFAFAKRYSFLVFAYIGFVLMLTQGFLYRRLARRLNEVTLMTLGIIFMAAGVGGLGAATVIGAWIRQAEQAPSIASILGLLASPGEENALLAAFTLASQRALREALPGTVNIGLAFALTFSVIGFAFLTPSAQALVSRRTDPNHQGEILGVNQSASAMARIIGPIFGVVLYKSTQTHLLPYAFGAALLLLMLPMMPRISRG